MCQHRTGGPFAGGSKFTNAVSPKCVVLLGTKSSLIASFRLACQTGDVSFLRIWQNKLSDPLHASIYQKATVTMVVETYIPTAKATLGRGEYLTRYFIPIFRHRWQPTTLWRGKQGSEIASDSRKGNYKPLSHPWTFPSALFNTRKENQ